MTLSRRKDWDQDCPTGEIIEFYSCLCCPDSCNYTWDENYGISGQPICDYDEKDKKELNEFPYIPNWCPRLETSWICITSISQEDFLYKNQLWKNLSEEGKTVLKTLFRLPEEFITSNKVIIKAIISGILREKRQESATPILTTNRVFHELKTFVFNLLDGR